jgi:hypothetical protein
MIDAAAAAIIRWHEDGGAAVCRRDSWLLEEEDPCTDKRVKGVRPMHD